MKNLLAKVALCLGVFGLCLYHTIHQQNVLTRMRMQIPLLAKQVITIHQANAKLQYEIDAFESPQHLLELASSPMYAHLRHPLNNQVLAVRSGSALQAKERQEALLTSNPRLQLATGAHR